MWDSAALSLLLSIHPTHSAINIGGIPHLAKNERDVGHPSLVVEKEFDNKSFYLFRISRAMIRR
jgi:hypothetical protein